MKFEDWKNKIDSFIKMDMRGAQANFFPGLYKKAENIEVGCGLEIVQSFEPIPLYDALEKIGYLHHTVKVSEGEYHVYFYRVEKKEDEKKSPFKPIALLNYPIIDEELGQLAVEFWDLTWKSDKRVLPYETRLLLSLTNAVGAGRMRQASRELIKAYAYGVDSKVFDDVFELLAWNQGIGFFSSEIGPSTLFKAYKMIKNMEKRGAERQEIVDKLIENFGEKHKDVSVE